MDTDSPSLSCVLLVDAWFPLSSDGPGEFSGLQVHVLKLRTELERLDHRVELFFPSNPNPLIRWSWTLIVIYQVLAYARQHRIDVIHSHGLFSAIPAKILAFILKKPHLHTIHRAAHLALARRTPRAFLEWLIYTRFQYSHLISLSHHFSSSVACRSQVRAIPNGIDLDSFDEVNVPKDPHPSLIWVGRDDPSKGLEYFRKAIMRVRKRYPHLQVRLISDGTITGRKLIEAYKQSHIFVLPSLHETQPLSLLEAWAAKLPVIVTKVGDNPLMVQDGINGLLVDPANVKQLTTAILKLLRARVSHERMGEAGYRYVAKHYSWSEVALTTLKVYKKSISEFSQDHETQSKAHQETSMSRLPRQHSFPAISKN